MLCNQSVGLIARGLEESGISTVSVTFRREIMELSRPPRIISVKSAPGKPLGNPGDRKMQRRVIEAGFNLLQRAIDSMNVIDIA